MMKKVAALLMFVLVLTPAVAYADDGGSYGQPTPTVPARYEEDSGTDRAQLSSCVLYGDTARLDC
jgi:hypothetical protein